MAIKQVYGDKAQCVGYSEIDKHAIKEYERHYPNHNNLGDVTKITKKNIDALGKVDLIVAGFPCNDLSSAKHKGRDGLEGAKSGLFWTMIKIIKWARYNNPNLHFIIENNASMANKWRNMITLELSKVVKQQVYCNYIDSSQWVLQRRRRYYWTLKEIPMYTKTRRSTMASVLDPIDTEFDFASAKIINYFNQNPFNLQRKSIIVVKQGIAYAAKDVEFQTRWKTRHSSSKNNFIRCINTQIHDNIIFDYRLLEESELFIPRYLTKNEMNKLSGFPKNYVKTNQKSKYVKLYGMTVIPPVIKHILVHLIP